MTNRANITRAWAAENVAATLELAATVRANLRMCRDQLMLDDADRPVDEPEATQASTHGCIRIAASRLRPDNLHGARDLNWQSATAFDRFIGHSITHYDQQPRTIESAIADLKLCAAMARDHQIKATP